MKTTEQLQREFDTFKALINKKLGALKITEGSASSGASLFTALLDTPADYSGSALYVLCVNSALGGIEFLPAQQGVVEIKTDDYVIQAADLGKILGMNAAGTKTFTLPSVTAADVGKKIRILKLGIGKLIIQTADADTINDSSAGGTLYNDLADETFSLVELMLITETQWIIVFYTSIGFGWRTT